MSDCVVEIDLSEEFIVSFVRCIWMRDQVTKNKMQEGKAWWRRWQHDGARVRERYFPFPSSGRSRPPRLRIRAGKDKAIPHSEVVAYDQPQRLRNPQNPPPGISIAGLGCVTAVSVARCPSGEEYIRIGRCPRSVLGSHNAASPLTRRQHGCTLERDNLAVHSGQPQGLVHRFVCLVRSLHQSRRSFTHTWADSVVLNMVTSKVFWVSTPPCTILQSLQTDSCM